MRLLALDTAGTTGTVALAKSDADGTLALLNSASLPGREFSTTALTTRMISAAAVSGLSRTAVAQVISS